MSVIVFRLAIDKVGMLCSAKRWFYHDYYTVPPFQRQSIPDDKSSITQFSIIQDELDAKLRVIVEKPVNPKKDQPHVVNLKNLYQSCVNTS